MLRWARGGDIPWGDTGLALLPQPGSPSIPAGPGFGLRLNEQPVEKPSLVFFLLTRTPKGDARCHLGGLERARRAGRSENAKTR